MRIAIATMAAALLALTGCAEGDPDGEGANVVQDDTGGETEPTADETTQEEEPTEQATGTRENPLAIGTTAQIGDWEATVTEVNPDAGEEVMAENEFNDPPADGEQFVMITVEATYVGEDSGNFFADFIYRVVGAGGNSFEESCGVIPNDIQEEGETFTDASISGNLCFRVDADQVDGGSFMLEGFTFDDTERTFWSLQ